MKISGIYSITNLANGKRYYGSTVDFRCRRGLHLSCLRRGVHHNRHLQHAWSKYGDAAFSVQMEIECHPQLLKWIENIYIPHGEYNIAADSISPTAGRKLSAEARARIAAAKRGSKNPMYGKKGSECPTFGLKTWLGRKHSEATKTKISKVQVGHSVSAETRTKISIAKKGCRGTCRGRGKGYVLDSSHGRKKKWRVMVLGVRAAFATEAEAIAFVSTIRSQDK